MVYLRQEYDARVFHGRYGVIEIRSWRDGRLAVVFRSKDLHNMVGEMWINLIVDGAVSDEKIISVLRLANGEETGPDIQTIRNATSDIAHSK